MLWACSLKENIKYRKKPSLGHEKFSVMPWDFFFFASGIRFFHAGMELGYAQCWA